MADSVKVNFFVVGQPKTGTTSLYHYFKGHPEIFTPDQKQLYHFAKDHNLHRQTVAKYRREYYKRYYNYSFNDYLKHFNFNSEKAVFCDITPDYIYSDVAHKNIHEYNNNAKVLILLREPVSFLKSFHNQLVNSGNELEKNFKKALALESTRIKTSKKQNESAPPHYFRYSELVNYQKHVKKYHDHFGENLKVISYESFKKNNELYLSAIYKWLGVSDIQIDRKIQVNISKKNSIGFIRKLKALYVVRVISSLMPDKFKEHLKNLIPERKTKTLNVEKRVNLESDLELKEKFQNNVLDTWDYLSENNLMLLEDDLVKIWDY